MKTIQEKAVKHVESVFSNFAELTKRPWPEFKDALTELFLAGATEALAGQWVELTTESAPPINQEVLCLGETGDVAVLQMIYTQLKPMGYQLTWLPKVNCKITHWMRIPELPKLDKR